MALAVLSLGAMHVSARQYTRPTPDFRGVWASNGAHCKWPDEFMLIYEKGTASFPFRGTFEPDRRCRILSVLHAGMTWTLGLSCTHPDPDYRLPEPFTVTQTLRMSGDGQRMTVETAPVLGQPARMEDAVYCRDAGENQPPLQCMDDDGKAIDCPP
jgi:hypothetical protein